MKRTLIPPVGLGSTVFWFGNSKAERAMKEAIQSGLIPMVDCAEMYGNGRCEETVGRILKQTQRKVYLVDKILPQNATPSRFRSSLKNSLTRLGIDHIDLYLLHWRANADLAFVSEAMEQAVHDGLILSWGVSNFDTRDMIDLFSCPYGSRCAVDQILYNIAERGAEYDLIPWLKEHDVLPMSYSSLGSDVTSLRKQCAESPVIRRIMRETGLSASAVMIAFNRRMDMPVLFSSSSFEHMKDNLQGLSLDIVPYMAQIDSVFAPPAHKVPLAKL